MKKLLHFVLSLIILCFICLAHTLLVFSSQTSIQNNFIQYNQALGSQSKKIDQATRDYLAGSSTQLPKGVYAEHEVKHLQDVKYLFDLSRIILVVLAFLLVAIIFVLIRFGLFNSRYLYRAFIWNLVFIFLFIVAIYVNFDLTFVYFHKAVFNNDLWIMSDTDFLPTLYSREFFIDCTNTIAFNALLNLFVLMLVIRVSSYWNRRS